MHAGAEVERPLTSLVVVELGSSVAAPYAGQILGDLGADVVKVEKPGGDDARRWGPPFWDGASATFQALNRNKRSVVCNLRDPGEVAALSRFIVDRADVVLQNLRPGLVETLGLGPRLVETKPALVYCNLGAFGRPGPLAEYVYRLADGTPYGRVLRLPGKRFSQGTWTGSAWEPKAPARRLPYRLPELAAAPAEAMIYWCEGERDCDTLAGLGLTASTSPGGWWPRSWSCTPTGGR